MFTSYMSMVQILLDCFVHLGNATFPHYFKSQGVLRPYSLYRLLQLKFQMVQRCTLDGEIEKLYRRFGIVGEAPTGKHGISSSSKGSSPPRRITLIMNGSPERRGPSQSDQSSWMHFYEVKRRFQSGFESANGEQTDNSPRTIHVHSSIQCQQGFQSLGVHF